MGGERLLVSLHCFVCAFSLLGCVCVVVAGVKGSGQRYSTITPLEQELYNELRPEIRDSDFIHPYPHSATATPYLHLPVFRHHSAPTVSKDMFSPLVGRKVLPSVLSNILIPEGHQPYFQVTPVNNNHGVEVWCGYSKITVRIDLALLSFRSSAPHFRLGTCPASGVDRSIVYFHYALTECGSLLTVTQGQLLYDNEVRYRPQSQGAVIRAMPLMLPIQCVYNRFHYSYKIGYLPARRWQSFRKTMVRKRVFSLTVCNDKWEELGMNQSYVLGELMYFKVSAGGLLKDARVYIEACHVSQSEEANSTHHYDVISNFGCMVDSKRTGSQSGFISRHRNVLRFTLDAFSFSDVTSERFYLHCTVRVGNVDTSATAKSCTYSESENSWEELHGNHSVCSCCDSQCLPPGSDLSSCGELVMVSSKPWSLINGSSETSDEWLDTVSGLVLFHHTHPPEGEESKDGEEELYVGTELEEEVLMGSVETDDEMMGDGVMEDLDTAFAVRNREKKKNRVNAEEVQEEEGVMMTNVSVEMSDEASLKGNMSMNVSSVDVEPSLGDAFERITME